MAQVAVVSILDGESNRAGRNFVNALAAVQVRASKTEIGR